MRCRRQHTFLSSYLDGELTDRHKKRLEQHLGSCPHCQEKLARLRQYREIASQVPQPAVPEELRERIISACQKQQEKSRIPLKKPGRKLMLPVLTGAAALLFGLLFIPPGIFRPLNLEADLVEHVEKRGKGPVSQPKGKQAGEKGNPYAWFYQRVDILGGEIISEEINSISGRLDGIVFEIPKESYRILRSDLSNLPITYILPTVPRWSLKKSVTVHLSLPRRRLLTGDFSGDGYDDLLIHYTGGFQFGQWELYANRGDASFAESKIMEMNDLMPYAPESWALVAMDMNGDGYDDLVTLGLDGSIPVHQRVFYNKQGQAFSQTETWEIEEDRLPGSGSLQIMSGDVNGDGQEDLLLHYLNGKMAGSWFWAAGSPEARFKKWQEASIPNQDLFIGLDYIPMVLDFDGDGRDDIGFYGRGGDIDARWFVSLNRDQQFEPARLIRFGDSPMAFQGSYLPFTGDYNQDGYSDLLVKMGTVNQISTWHLLFNESGERFGLGREIEIEKR